MEEATEGIEGGTVPTPRVYKTPLNAPVLTYMLAAAGGLIAIISILLLVVILCKPTLRRSGPALLILVFTVLAVCHVAITTPAHAHCMTRPEPWHSCDDQDGMWPLGAIVPIALNGLWMVMICLLITILADKCVQVLHPDWHANHVQSVKCYIVIIVITVIVAIGLLCVPLFVDWIFLIKSKCFIFCRIEYYISYSFIAVMYLFPMVVLIIETLIIGLTTRKLRTNTEVSVVHVTQAQEATMFAVALCICFDLPWIPFVGLALRTVILSSLGDSRDGHELVTVCYYFGEMGIVLLLIVCFVYGRGIRMACMRACHCPCVKGIPEDDAEEGAAEEVRGDAETQPLTKTTEDIEAAQEPTEPLPNTDLDKEEPEEETQPNAANIDDEKLNTVGVIPSMDIEEEEKEPPLPEKKSKDKGSKKEDERLIEIDEPVKQPENKPLSTSEDIELHPDVVPVIVKTEPDEQEESLPLTNIETEKHDAGEENSSPAKNEIPEKTGAEGTAV